MLLTLQSLQTCQLRLTLLCSHLRQSTRLLQARLLLLTRPSFLKPQKLLTLPKILSLRLLPTLQSIHLHLCFLNFPLIPRSLTILKLQKIPCFLSLHSTLLLQLLPKTLSHPKLQCFQMLH